eukprot:TRINITY_DN236_c4_g1_i1.p1 TRINITY_DN236_c4_g1~~TRINITY_DN236_c4_g1_i1.p1  ORF type:complete len:164 (+),score=1.42 TRINITY_DN236_c4_g1_i1:300-791(+)
MLKMIAFCNAHFALRISYRGKRGYPKTSVLIEVTIITLIAHDKTLQQMQFTQYSYQKIARIYRGYSEASKQLSISQIFPGINFQITTFQDTKIHSRSDNTASFPVSKNFLFGSCHESVQLSYFVVKYAFYQQIQVRLYQSITNQKMHFVHVAKTVLIMDLRQQ